MNKKNQFQAYQEFQSKIVIYSQKYLLKKENRYTKKVMIISKHYY